VLKDLQRHPAKPFVLHVDFQRVSMEEKLRLTVPLHFENEATAVGVKKGGVVSHNLTEVEITCLPKDLPEFIAVDMAAMEIGDMMQVGRAGPARGCGADPCAGAGYAGRHDSGGLRRLRVGRRTARKMPTAGRGLRRFRANKYTAWLVRAPAFFARQRGIERLCTRCRFAEGTESCGSVYLFPAIP
jgi:hypothetical protein